MVGRYSLIKESGYGETKLKNFENVDGETILRWSRILQGNNNNNQDRVDFSTVGL